MTFGGPAEAADRIIARTFSRVLRAGSGTCARYSSTSFGTGRPFARDHEFPTSLFSWAQCYAVRPASKKPLRKHGLRVPMRANEIWRSH